METYENVEQDFGFESFRHGGEGAVGGGEIHAGHVPVSAVREHQDGSGGNNHFTERRLEDDVAMVLLRFDELDDRDEGEGPNVSND